MRKLSTLILFSLFIMLNSIAQTGQTLNPDHVVITEHSVTVKGNKIPYKAIAGTLPVFGDSGKVIAGVFFTYYERSDIKDRSARPLIISFNGGPGT